MVRGDGQQLGLFSIRKLLFLRKIQCLRMPVGVAKDRKSWQQGRGSQRPHIYSGVGRVPW